MDFGPLARFGLLLVRPAMIVAAAPAFGGAFAPTQARVGLAVLLAITLLPLVAVPDVNGSILVVGIVVREMAIGLALALTVQALLAGAELAGQLSGYQLGLSYGSMVDPQSGVRNNLLAALYGNLALLTFFLTNGHHAIIRTLASSYALLPIGGGRIDASIVRAVIDMLALIVVLGVRLAMPLIVVLLLLELTMGFISRAAPAINLMAVGMPLRLIVGLIVIASAISAAPPLIARFETISAEIGQRAARSFR
jgi:flagellar biosynthetic protein FliR